MLGIAKLKWTLPGLISQAESPYQEIYFETSNY